ncbi:hypothetical protein DFH09DRAFT_1445074 [Mycena vulgaris]|nr:hypothetical protein DFH09DRAFT_1445074 [Mycena vulgaris]
MDVCVEALLRGVAFSPAMSSRLGVCYVPSLRPAALHRGVAASLLLRRRRVILFFFCGGGVSSSLLVLSIAQPTPPAANTALTNPREVIHMCTLLADPNFIALSVACRKVCFCFLARPPFPTPHYLALFITFPVLPHRLPSSSPHHFPLRHARPPVLFTHLRGPLPPHLPAVLSPYSLALISSVPNSPSFLQIDQHHEHYYLLRPHHPLRSLFPLLRPRRRRPLALDAACGEQLRIEALLAAGGGVGGRGEGGMAQALALRELLLYVGGGLILVRVVLGVVWLVTLVSD